MHSGKLLVIMAVIAVISFQFPKKIFLMFYNIQTLCDTVCIFSLHLINCKGVIGFPVAMAPIFFFVLEHGVTRIFRKQAIYVIITLFTVSSTHISGWIIKKVIDSYKPGDPSIPLPKLFSLKLLEKSQLSEYPS